MVRVALGFLSKTGKIVPKSYVTLGHKLDEWMHANQEQLFPFKSDHQGLHYLATCRLHYLKGANNVTLRPTLSLDAGPELNDTRWDPSRGIYFQLAPPFQHYNSVICSLGEDQIKFLLAKRVGKTIVGPNVD